MEHINAEYMKKLKGYLAEIKTFKNEIFMNNEQIKSIKNMIKEDGVVSPAMFNALINAMDDPDKTQDKIDNLTEAMELIGSIKP
jgi:hypothetical protein